MRRASEAGEKDESEPVSREGEDDALRAAVPDALLSLESKAPRGVLSADAPPAQRSRGIRANPHKSAGRSKDFFIDYIIGGEGWGDGPEQDVSSEHLG